MAFVVQVPQTQTATAGATAAPATATFDDRYILDVDALARDLAATDQPLSVLRAALARGDAALQALFQQGKGIPATVLVPARARFIDKLLVTAWSLFLPVESKQLALVAVGGYGRGELHPGSDIDILILAEESAIGEQRESLERFLTLLWDLGLEIGQSVRTLDDCVTESLKNVTVVTNLMEARQLAGEPSLLAQMRERISPDRLWSNREFFEAKKDEQKSRYHKYHETGYNLEPNVKEGSGGLRDLQTIAWVAKRYFGASTWYDLVEHEFLTEREYRELIDCQGFLWQVRFALHALTGRLYALTAASCR